MARARNIKPSFFQDDKLGELPIYSRMAFIGLWTLSDFKGCLEFRPKMLKVQLLPYDECNIEEVVNALEEARFIRYYSIQGKRYIKIVNFEKHQNPHKNEREAGSDIPDYVENSIETVELKQDGIKPDLIGTARADSLLLIPDSSKPTSQSNAHDPEKFAMRIGWEPSAHVADLARQSGAPLADGDLPEFMAHWLTEPATKRTQAEWDKALLQCAKHRKLRAASPLPSTVKQPRKTEDFSKKDYGTEIRPL